MMKKLFCALLCMALAIGMAACAPQPATPPEAPTPEPAPQPEQPATPTPAEPAPLSADVVVVGGGLAGLTAALAAEETGASVILLEKLAMLGGSSMYSGGGIGAAGSSVQAAYGIEDSAEDWRALWVERQAQSLTESTQYPDMERVDWLIAQGPALIDWLLSKGVVYPRPLNYGVDPVERLHHPQNPQEAAGVTGSGVHLMQYLSTAAESAGIQILLQTPATGLVQEGGKITGVEIATADGPATILAKAVVLAAGGFAQSPELLQRFIPTLPPVTSVASPGTTGDGILMAEQAGAALYEEPWIIGLYTGLTERSDLSNLPYIANLYVAPSGKRVMNENSHYALITNAAIGAGGELYMIFDSASPEIAGMIEANLGESAYKGDTYEALAEAAGIDPAAFAKTMAAYNGYAKAGVDKDFGKDAALLVEVATAPYYAVKVLPNIMGTVGGVKTQETGEVLDTAGAVIPGLYAAGETANRPIYNQVYMSGSSLAFAATSGKAAGGAAAAFAKE